MTIITCNTQNHCDFCIANCQYHPIVKIGLILLVAALPFAGALGEADTSKAALWLKRNERFVPEFKTMVQLWGLYSTGMEVYNSDRNLYEPVDDRINLMLRRARFIVSGEPYNNLRYTVVFFYDQTGRDLLASGIGPANKADPMAGIWDAFFQWKITKNEWAYLTAGWFRPQVQRESITSGWSVNSFEKSMSQNYLRTHLVGTGAGRAMGINLGGLMDAGDFDLNYNFGFFNPQTPVLPGAAAAKTLSPLWAGRLSLSLGDPEMEKYGINYDINYFNKRKGVSLDLNATRQGPTDLFRSATTFGPGFLLNWGPLNLDGEWMWMEREGNRKKGSSQTPAFAAKSGTGHARAGVNIPAGRFVVEPIFMIMQFQGALDAAGQSNASAVKSSYGAETTYDAGINWYLDSKNLKIMLHYTWRTGDPGEAADGTLANMYFNQPSIGAIRRGNWLGLGVNAIF